MKTAVIFYSLDGNCKLVAEEIKLKLDSDSDSDLIQLHVKGEKKRRGIFKFFWCGGFIISGKNPPLEPYTFDPSAYDLIIIGAPVWASSPAAPIKTFISEAGITGKKIALFVCHAGGKEDALEKFKALLPGNEILEEADFISPVKNNGEKIKKQIAYWVKRLVPDKD
jgi:flavodoxin